MEYSARHRRSSVEKDESHLLVRVEKPEQVLTALKEVECLDSLLLAGFFDRARKVAPESERAKRLPAAPDHADAEFEANGKAWRGRIYDISFPVPLKTFEGEGIAGISMKFGVSSEFLKVSEGGAPAWNDLDLLIRRGDQHRGFQRRSFIGYGESFIAEIDLL